MPTITKYVGSASFGPGAPWSDLSNILGVSDGNFATSSVSLLQQSTGIISMGGFGFAHRVPLRSTIAGITVNVRAKDSVGFTQFDNVKLLNASGNAVGDNKASGVGNLSTDLETYSIGGVSDTWNASLTAEDIADPKTDFGVQLRFSRNGTDATVSVEWVSIGVTFGIPAFRMTSPRTISRMLRFGRKPAKQVIWSNPSAF